MNAHTHTHTLSDILSSTCEKAKDRNIMEKLPLGVENGQEST